MTAKFDVKDAQYATKLALCSLVYMSLVWYNRNVDSVSAGIMVCQHDACTVFVRLLLV